MYEVVVRPACWPIYSGLLGSLGLGFVNYTPYLLPLTVFFLALSLASLAYRARSRRGYRPFFLGLPATAMVIVGKFVFDSDMALYSGAALLVGVSFWNSSPKSLVSRFLFKQIKNGCGFTGTEETHHHIGWDIGKLSGHLGLIHVGRKL